MINQYIQCARSDNQNTSIKHTIETIKSAGFDGVFIQWYDKNQDFTIQQQVDLCKELGLKILFAHFEYKEINNIWIEGESGDKLVKKYLQNLDECKLNGIDMVCMHLTSKYIAPDPNNLGIQRLQTIIDYAEKLGIKIAFENTKIHGYLEYVFNRIKNKNAGICYDAGHCHCHFHDKFSWEKFKNKIFAVHLHDNDQSKDQHLLPFDGTIDWQKLVNNLKETNYNGPVILESCYQNQYLNMPLLEFYKLSLEKAKKIYNLQNKN
ncbi:MAG: sugar phosphate isomerase/epimerase [Clostridia bacterium]|nr:sugar phosphate isomerase/epimerase [Clostridia bacterium]